MLSVTVSVCVFCVLRDSLGRRYLVVVASTKENAAAGGVPLYEAHAAAVTIQLHDRLRHVPPQTTLGDLPYPHLGCTHVRSHPPTHTHSHKYTYTQTVMHMHTYAKINIHTQAQ